MNNFSLQEMQEKIAEAITRIDRNRTLAYQDLKEGDGYEVLEYLENMSVWISEAHELVSAIGKQWQVALRESIQNVLTRRQALEKEEIISEKVKGMIATFLLRQSIPFSMLPLPERRYLILVAPNVRGGLQTEIERVQERGLVDDDDTLAWFRYKQALISTILSQPGYTSEFHYRYQTPSMEGPKEFDVRDLDTFQEGTDHKQVIRSAIESGELRPKASFLDEANFELWELS